MKAKAPTKTPFSRDWRVNYAALASEVAASPLSTRQLRRSAARQLASQMAKTMFTAVQGRFNKEPGAPTWRRTRTERRLVARNMARKLEVPMVSRQFHFA